MKKHFILLTVLICFYINYSKCSKDDKSEESQVSSFVTYIDSPLQDVIWCRDDRTGKNNSNVLILTEKGTVYQSQDGGVTWVN